MSNAGIHFIKIKESINKIPAFAGMTKNLKSCQLK